MFIFCLHVHNFVYMFMFCLHVSFTCTCFVYMFMFRLHVHVSFTCSVIYLQLNYSTCFGRPSRPSSGLHKTLVARNYKYKIYGLVFITETECVYCAVLIECLHTIPFSVMFKFLMDKVVLCSSPQLRRRKNSGTNCNWRHLTAKLQFHTVTKLGSKNLSVLFAAQCYSFKFCQFQIFPASNIRQVYFLEIIRQTAIYPMGFDADTDDRKEGESLQLDVRSGVSRWLSECPSSKGTQAS